MSRKTRKLMWSVPLIAAVAVIGALAAFVALQPGSLFADELGMAPQNLKVAAADGSAGRTTLVVTWEAPESGAPDMYRIDRSSDNDKWKYLTSVSGTTLTHTDSTVGGKFEEGKTRYYRVFAVDGAHGEDGGYGAGAVSTSESATTDPITVPHQVKPFDASGSGPEMINLSWTAPDDGGSPILGYCIRIWPTGTTSTTITPIRDADSTDNDDTNCRDEFFETGPGGDIGDYRSDANPPLNNQEGGVIRILPGTSYTHESLRAGQKWSYEIHALNEHGSSETASATREAETDSANDPPMPGNLLIRQSTGDTVDLYWTISGDGGQDISAYRVEVSNTASQWPNEDTTLPNAETTRASTTALTARDLDADNVALPGSPLVAVINVPHIVDDENGYNLRHTPAQTGTLHYRVRVETGSGGGTKTSAYSMGSVVVAPEAGDDAFAHGDSNPNSPTLDADANDTTTDGSQTNLETDMNDQPTDDDTVPGEIKLTVDKSTVGGSDSYRVDISSNDGETWTMVHSSTRPINETEYEHQGLKPNKVRHFRFFTKKGSNYGIVSNVVGDVSAHSQAPGPVKDLSVAAEGAGQINVSWSAPDSNGGAMIDKYCIIAEQVNDETPRVVQNTPFARTDIRVVEDTNDMAPNCARFSLPEDDTIDDAANGIYDVAASTTSVSFTKLSRQTRWQFEVYALNGATVDGQPADNAATLKGVALESEVDDDKTSNSMVPDAPKNLTAELARDTNFSGIGSRGVLVLWNAPSDPAGDPVVGYKVERKVDDGEFEEKVSSRSYKTTYWVDTDEPGTDEVRTYRVTSINGKGTGTAMSTITIPLDATHSHEPETVELTVPTTVVATSDAAGSLTLTWEGADNADLYVLIAVNLDADPISWETETVTDGAARTGTVTGLTSGTRYLGIVVATQGTGTSLDVLYETAEIVTVQ